MPATNTNRRFGHVALTVENLEACDQFYVDLFRNGVEMATRVLGQGLPEHSGNDNLAFAPWLKNYQ